MSKDATNDLIHAVREGNVQTAKTLIATFGLCFSEEWSNGYDLLCEALRNKHKKIAELLLTSGASVNGKNNQISDTPLHLAVKNGYREIVLMLLDREANINAKNHSNETPLHIAVDMTRHRGTYDIFKSLLETPVNMETRDKNDKNILSRKVEVNAKLNNGRTALHIAVSIKPPEIIEDKLVRLLVKHGADIHATDEDGLTPLHVSIIEDGAIYFTLTLLGLGAKVDARDKFGRTALHYAAKNNNEQMIEFLLKLFADPNVICKDSLMPMDYADLSLSLSEEILLSKALNLPVKDTHLKKIFTSNSNGELLLLFKDIKFDVEVIKTKMIGSSNVTYYNFLTCGTKQLAVYGRDERIVEGLHEEHFKWGFFESSKWGFSAHVNMMYRRRKKIKDIQKKQNLLNSSLKSVHELTGYVLPDLPALEICEYLTIDEMEKLIKAYPSAD